MTEKYYDEVIAPKLSEIATLCHQNGMPFLAVVEYKKGSRGRTFTPKANPSFEMVAINHAAKVMPNVDSFIIGIKRYCLENGIDHSSSIYMNIDKWSSDPVRPNPKDHRGGEAVSGASSLLGGPDRSDDQ
jgi:hypothetical protein